MSCAFCQIASGALEVSLVYQDPHILAFPDHAPIREGHVQIIPRLHVPYFDDLPEDLAGRILRLGQRIARVQKRVYGVSRVGFVFSGGDVDHVHAHLIPIHEVTDLTSMRYFALGANLPPRDLRIDAAAAASVAGQIAGAL